MSENASFAQLGEAVMLAADSCADQPNILIVATDRWYPTARLGVALSDVGCTIDAVCPSKHPLRFTRSLRRMYAYRGLSPLSSIGAAIRESNPTLIIPADDLAAWHLHDLHQRESARGDSTSKLIERSLGSAENFAAVSARAPFIQAAMGEGIRVPKTAVIGRNSELHEWIAENGFPTVLKANGTSGGDGVKVVNTVEEAERAFRKLQAPPLLARALKRAMIDHDLTLMQPSLLRRRAVVNAQAFIRGREATSAMFCWEGKVLASLHFEVIQKMGATGHATVVRRIDHPEISSVAQKIAKRLKLSGFHGLDFMIENDTSRAYLIEINPRTTQVGHLAMGEGRDLPAALHCAIKGRHPNSAGRPIENDTVALFPNEWMRDPKSVYLRTAFHDVPWQEAALFRSCVSNSKQQSRWYQGQSGGTALGKLKEDAISKDTGTLAQVSGALRSQD